MYSKLQDGSFMIAGYVARDAEMKTSQNGKTFTKWSVAVGKKPSQNQPDKSESIWTNCIAWHDQARAAGGIKKGDAVFCIGRIEISEYEGKTYKTLNCEYVSIMGKSSASVPTAHEPAYASDNLLAEYEEIGNGDLPF